MMSNRVEEWEITRPWADGYKTVLSIEVPYVYVDGPLEVDTDGEPIGFNSELQIFPAVVFAAYVSDPCGEEGSWGMEFDPVEGYPTIDLTLEEMKDFEERLNDLAAAAAESRYDR